MKRAAVAGKRDLLLRGAAIVLLTTLAYLPALRAGFTWDDDDLIGDPSIRDDGLYISWFTTEPANYWPITNTCYWIEHQLWGLNPTGYHVVSVVQHILCALLLWRVLVQLKIPAAWLISLAFAVHPVNVESVAWVTQRKNLLSMLFYLLSLSAWLEFEERPRRSWYVGSLGLFLLSLLSKGAAATMPVVLLLCAWWRRGRIDRTDLKRVVPFFLLAGVMSLVEIWFQYMRAIGDVVVRDDSFLSRLAGAGWVAWFYLYKAWLPLQLSFVYPRWQIDPHRLLSYLPNLALLTVLLLAWRARRTWGRPVLFALVYYIVVLAPVLGFFNIFYMRYSLVADHYQYIALAAPLALAIGAATVRLRPAPRWLATALGGLLVLTLAGLSWRQSSVYDNAESLWRDTLAKNPSAVLAYHNLALELREQGKLDEANQLLRTAMILEPEFEETYNALGRTLELQNRQREAIHFYQRAIELKPNDVQAHYNLGNALRSLGRLDEAEAEYRKAIAIDPRDAPSLLNLAVTLSAKQKFEEALPFYAETLRLRPDYALAHQNLGLALAALERPQEAFEHLKLAVDLEPTNAMSHFYLALLLAKVGNTQPAIIHLQESLRLAPDFAPAQQALSELTQPPEK